MAQTRLLLAPLLVLVLVGCPRLATPLLLWSQLLGAFDSRQ
jgi:hypothetical protein